MQRNIQTMEPFGLNAERKQQELAVDFDSRMFGYLKLDTQDSSGQKKLITKTIGCIDKALVGLRREGTSKEAIGKRSEANAKLYCILGHLHLLLSDFAKALSAYQRYYDLCKTSWEDVTFLYGLAIVYFHYNAYKWATRAFQQVLYIEPGFLRASEVHIRLGLIFMVNGDCETSLKHFRLALNDSSPCSISKFEVQFHIAHVYVLQEKPQAAKQAYEQLLGVPDLPQTLRANTLQQLGWLYHTESNLGDSQVRAAHAIQLLQKSLEADPTSGQSWYFLGRCFSAIGKVHDAFVSYRHSIDKSEASADTWCSIGVLYQQQSQPMDALQAYICAVQLEKDHTAAWTDLGILYESCNQLEDALTCYKNAAKDTKDVNPTLTNRIKAVQQEIAAIPLQRAPKTSKTLPSIQEAWSLPIPAELTSRQGANSQQQLLQQQQQARVAAVAAAGMAGGYSQMASLYSGVQKPPPPPYPQVGAPPPYPTGGTPSSQHPGSGTPGSSPGPYPGAQTFPTPGGSAEQQTSPARKRRRGNNKKNEPSCCTVPSVLVQGVTEPPPKQSFFLTLQQMQMLRFLQENQTKLDSQQQLLLQHLQQQYFRQQSYVGQQQQQQQQSQGATPGSNNSMSSDAADLHPSPVCDTEQVAFLAEDLLELFMKQQNKESETSNWQADKFTSRICGAKSFNGSHRGEKPTDASGASSCGISDYKLEHSEFDTDTQFSVRMPSELASPSCVHMTADEIIASCKDQNVNSVSNLSILGKCQVPAPPVTPSPPLPKDKLNPPTPSVYMETKKEAFSIELQQYVLSQPVCVIRGLATALKLDLGLFSTKSLVESNPDYQVEVRSQRLQTPDDNKDANNMTIWRCESSRSHTTVAKYAQYQASSFQESLREEQDKSKGVHKDSDTDSNSSVKGKKKFRMIKFGTNVDLSNEKKWKAQLQELGKLPAFTRVVAASNVLSHIGHKILGMNTVQLYMKVPGSRTPGHQENLNYAAVNINIGPGDCEWFGVPESYWGVIHQLCEQNGINYLTGSWWPNLEDLFENDVPVYRFIQKPGDLVWVNGGTVHWVQAIGWCNNIAWNVGPLTFKQYMLSAERYEYNKLQLCKSLVPMVQLSWNLARNVHVTDTRLYDLIKTCLCHSLRHSRIVIDYAHSLGKEVKFYGHAENEAAHYCSNCEVEVFNILFVMEQDKKHVVECLECARRASNILDGFVVLSQYKMDDLKSVYDNFHLSTAAMTTGTVATTTGTAPTTICTVAMTTGTIATTTGKATPAPQTDTKGS